MSETVPPGGVDREGTGLRLVLASGSPRRKQLLERAGLRFDVISPDIDEAALPGEDAVSTALRLADAKARAVMTTVTEPAIVIAADTLVMLGSAALSKPVDPQDARRMLRAMSGRSHEVVTAYAVLRGGGQPGAEPEERRVSAVTTSVRFRDLSDDVIERYVATGEPLDKAGAYGIQGIGAMLVIAIVGSYTNVVGLPVVEVLDDLAAVGGPWR